MPKAAPEDELVELLLDDVLDVELDAALEEELEDELDEELEEELDEDDELLVEGEFSSPPPPPQATRNTTKVTKIDLIRIFMRKNRLRRRIYCSDAKVLPAFHKLDFTLYYSSPAMV